MENIFIFIIIMIISSLISRNKKKKSSQRSDEQTKTIFNNSPKQKHLEQAPPQLGELLRRLQSMKQEAAGTRASGDPKNMAGQVKAAGSAEYSAKGNYEENVSYEEAEKETYSYDTLERNYDSAERTFDAETKPYDEVQSFDEKQTSYDDKSGGYMTSERRAQHSDANQTDKKIHVKTKFFDSRLKIKNAIIASEILQRKYT